MQHEHSLSLATTASGMVGGIGRAIAEQHSLSSISLHGVVDVALYAVVFTSVGYCIKVAWDGERGIRARSTAHHHHNTLKSSQTNHLATSQLELWAFPAAVYYNL